MQTDAPSDVSLMEVVRILFRHKKKVLCFFCLATLISGFLVLFKQKVYRSEAKLFLHVGRESVGLDPTATIGQTVSLRTTRETEINSTIEMLLSRAIAEQVVRSIGADAILAAADEPQWITSVRTQIASMIKQMKSAIFERLAGLKSTEAETFEDAVSLVMKNTRVRAAEMSSVITVSCKAQTPEMAQRIVATLVDVHAREHTRVNRIAGSEDFFRDQANLLRDTLSLTNQELSDLKNQKGIGSVEGQFRLLESQKADIEAQQLQNARELVRCEALVGSLKESLAELQPTIKTEWVEGLPNMAADGMRQQLYELEIRERELRSKYDDSHPMVKAIQKQVAEARQIQGTQTETREQSTHGINPNWQQMELALRQEEARLASLRESRATLQRQHDDVQTALADLNTYALQIDELERDARLLSSSFKTYSENFEQARIDSALLHRRITNVNVAQPATLLPKPVGPTKKLLLGLGMLIGMLGAVAIVLISEHFDQSLKSPIEVEQALGLPVLMAIPRRVRPGPRLIPKKAKVSSS